MAVILKKMIMATDKMRLYCRVNDHYGFEFATHSLPSQLELELSLFTIQQRRHRQSDRMRVFTIRFLLRFHLGFPPSAPSARCDPCECTHHTENHPESDRSEPSVRSRTRSHHGHGHGQRAMRTHVNECFMRRQAELRARRSLPRQISRRISHRILHQKHRHGVWRHTGAMRRRQRRRGEWRRRRAC